MTSDDALGPKVDRSVPQSARVWNYWLGGTDNYEVDRRAGDAYAEVYPQIVELARTSRLFLARAVGRLAGEAGVRQFLDIGAGLPTVDNTHEVAQRIAPDAHVVYVDNDPLVLAHVRALLAGTPEGATHYIEADLRDPDGLLDRVRTVLDFSRPVALMLMGVMGHIVDDEEAQSVVARLKDALAPGSHLALYDSTDTEASMNEVQSGVTTPRGRSRTGCGGPRSSTAISRAWSPSNPASCRVRGGGRRCDRSKRSTIPPCAEWPANPRPPAPSCGCPQTACSVFS